jgi:uncharacterized protein YxjI
MGLRRRGGGGNDGDDHLRFQIQEKLLSIGDDYWIEDSNGARAYKVDGKALRLRDKWVLEALDGHEVATIRERKLSIRDAITIDLDGRHATVKKALVGLRPRFHVDVDGAGELKVHGNVLSHEYEIERDGHHVAEVSKKWFRLRDTYGVEVDDPADAPLVLAVTVAVDALARG